MLEDIELKKQQILEDSRLCTVKAQTVNRYLATLFFEALPIKKDHWEAEAE